MPDIRPVLFVIAGSLVVMAGIETSLFLRADTEGQAMIISSVVFTMGMDLAVAATLILLLFIGLALLKFPLIAKSRKATQSEVISYLAEEKFDVVKPPSKLGTAGPFDMFGNTLQVGDYIICLEPKFAVLSRIESIPTGFKRSAMVNYSNGGKTTSDLVAKLTEGFDGDLLFTGGKTYKPRTFSTPDKSLTIVGA